MDRGSGGRPDGGKPTRAEEFYKQVERKGRPRRDPAAPPAEQVWRWKEEQTGLRQRLPVGFQLGVRYYARINHNRWIADCICGSAQVISPHDKRYACTDCGHGWVEVVWPADPAAVEAELMEREPLPHLRNWWHPEDPANPDTVRDDLGLPEPQPEEPEPKEPAPGPGRKGDRR